MRRFAAALLAAALLLSMPVMAATDGTTGNFVRSRTYAGEFSDLTEASGFYENVSALYEYGLSVGKANGTFGLKDPVTVGQLVIFAGRILSLYRHGNAETGAAGYPASDAGVYAPYLAYLQSAGVVGTELDGRYTLPATRGEVAHVLANVLPDGALEEIAAELVGDAYGCGKFITDVAADTAWRDDILELYRCGISRGSNERGDYLPGRFITRGALAAMLTRMMDPALRTVPEWDIVGAFSAAGATWGSLITGTPAYTAAPMTEGAAAQDAMWMLSKNAGTLTLSYGKLLTLSRVRWVMDQTLAAVKRCCEHSYNAVSCVYSYDTGKVTLTFSALSASPEQTAAYRAETLSAAAAVHDALWREGKLSWEMSQYDRAKVYYDWICANCVYDAAADDESLSHIPYALFKTGTAVCDGYTGAYNLLLKLEGIDCYSLSNDSHIWTVAELDGTEYHIDATWGDSAGSGTDYTFFAMTPTVSWGYHPW